jgi:hypothetical protein
MAENTDTMVLRSFHLPQGMDDELRGLAFSLHCAKADLLRFFIDQGMTNLLAEHDSTDWRSWTPEVLKLVAEEVHARGSSESIRQGLADDIARLDEAPAYASQR